jgi:hypothetical protein
LPVFREIGGAVFGFAVHRVGIEAAGIGGVREVVDAIGEVGRFARHHDDRLRRAEPHHLVGREQRTTVRMLALARRGGAGAILVRAAGTPNPDRVLSEGIGDVASRVVIGRAEELARGVGHEALPAWIDRPELGEILHKQPELCAIAA